MVKLIDLPCFIRSKNATPFITTIDIVFDDKDLYDKVRKSGILNKELVASLYSIRPKDVYCVFFVDNALAIKVSFMKPNGMASGDVGDRDLYGSDQCGPILSIDFP